MTLNEFRAWLEGYEQSFQDRDTLPDFSGQEEVPNIVQWKAIKARLETVEPESVRIPAALGDYTILGDGTFHSDTCRCGLCTTPLPTSVSTIDKYQVDFTAWKQAHDALAARESDAPATCFDFKAAT